MDNYPTHKYPLVKEWFAKRPRYHVHFTPTSSTAAPILRKIEMPCNLRVRALADGDSRFVAELLPVKSSVRTFAGEQNGVRTVLDDASVLDDENDIGR